VSILEDRHGVLAIDNRGRSRETQRIVQIRSEIEDLLIPKTDAFHNVHDVGRTELATLLFCLGMTRNAGSRRVGSAVRVQTTAPV